MDPTDYTDRRLTPSEPDSVSHIDLRTIADDLFTRAPDRLALIDAAGQWTFGEFRSAVLAATAHLRIAGAGPDQRILVVDLPSRLVLVSVFAIMRLGATATLINPKLTAAEVTALARLTGHGPVAVVGPGCQALVAGLDVTIAGPELLAPPSDAGAAYDDSAAVTEPTDAVLLFTSGTTGLPKPVPVPTPAMLTRLLPYVASPTPQVRMLCVPTHHVGGLVGALVSFVGGHTLVVQPTFDAGEWLRLVETHRVQLTFIVPTMLSRVLGHPSLPDRDLSSLQIVTYGASPMTEDLIVRLTAVMPHVGFVNTFGQTETLGGITLSAPADALHPIHRLSVGKLVPGVEARVVMPGTDEDVAPGSPGELLVHSKQNVVPGWIRTGDQVRIDADGYLYPEGRLADTINRGGEKFGPVEVENALRSHPSVLDCAVAGVPDAELNHRVGAVVVARQAVEVAELQAWCAGHIARFKTPELLVFVDEVPVTDMNKVDRKAVVGLLASSGE